MVVQRVALEGGAAASVALQKNALRMRRAVVPVTGSAAEIVGKQGAVGTDFAGRPQIQVRSQGRGGPRITSSRAAALRGCRGRRGCEFATCVEQALGTAPRNLQKACSGEREEGAGIRTRLTTGGSAAGRRAAVTRTTGRRGRRTAVAAEMPEEARSRFLGAIY